MVAANRPSAVTVDVVETLVSLDAVAAVLDGLGVGPHAIDRLFTRLLRDGFALAASGAYRPFREVADGALAAVAPALTARHRAEVLTAFSRLDSHPDARPGLERFHRAGLPVVALTNGAAATITVVLERAGLDDLVGRVISIDEVQTWKPSAAPYRHAADAMGVAPPRLAHVAVHGWDVHGAHRAGLVTGWASRLEGTFPAVFDAPDVAGADLVEVADGLLGLPDDTA
jgi:2-haloacid dehalogenase